MKKIFILHILQENVAYDIIFSHLVQTVFQMVFFSFFFFFAVNKKKD